MKKLFSKLCALVVAITMVLGVGMTAFAEGTTAPTPGQEVKGGSITIKGLDGTTEQTVKAYPIYYVDPTSTTGYTVVYEKFKEVTNNWGNEIPTAQLSSEDVTKLANAVAVGPLAEVASQKAAIGATSVIFNNLNAGAYLFIVTENTEEGKNTQFVYTPLVQVNYQFDNTGKLIAKDDEVDAKGSTNTFEKKTTDEDKVVQNGDIITYTIEAVVPYDATSFTVTDNIKGAEYYFPSVSNPNAVFNVKLQNDSTDTDLGEFTPAESGSPQEGYDHTFTVDLSNILRKNNYAGKTIVITYMAKVREATEITNIARSSNFKGAPPVTVNTGIAQIIKNGEGNDVLGGAKFALKNEKGEYAKFTTTNDNEIYVTGEWTSEKPAANSIDQLVTTNEKGIAIIKGLNVGTYKFVEIVAPEGYSINTTDETVTISKDSITEPQIATMKDTKLNTLPSTGGIGTYIFTIVGVAVMVVAAAFFIYNGKAHK